MYLVSQLIGFSHPPCVRIAPYACRESHRSRTRPRAQQERTSPSVAVQPAVLPDKSDRPAGTVYPPGNAPFARELHAIVNHPLVDLAGATLVILQCAVFALQTVGFGGTVDALLYAYNRAVTSLFVVEYFVRWYAVGLHPRFLFTRSMLIDFFAVLVPVAISVQLSSREDQLSVLFVRALRFTRVFQLQRVMDDEGMNKLFGNIPQSRRRFANVVLTVCTILYISGGLFYDFEKDINPGVTNMFSALYWAVNTLFTVGPGDIVPLSSQGRALSTATVLVGAVLIPLQLSEIVAAAMQARGEADKKTGITSKTKNNLVLNNDVSDSLTIAAESLPPANGRAAEINHRLAAESHEVMSVYFDVVVECPGCKLRVHQVDARFCRNCGTRLSHGED